MLRGILVCDHHVSTKHLIVCVNDDEKFDVLFDKYSTRRMNRSSR